MKTIRQWLEELPEPWRTQAIENTEREDVNESARRRENVNTFLVKQPTVYDALSYAFVWGDSPQGFEYWSMLSSTLNFIP